jgi:hypothetical protein
MLVIILDGFDEMAVRADSRTVERQLGEIERLIAPEHARVILTGRPEFFMSRQELEKALWRHGDRLSQRFKEYDAYRLTLWDNDQIDLFGTTACASICCNAWPSRPTLPKAAALLTRRHASRFCPS